MRNPGEEAVHGTHPWRGICGARGVRGRGHMVWGHVWQGLGMHGGGACMAGGHVWQERWPLQRTVRILLECIIVKTYHQTSKFFFFFFSFCNALTRIPMNKQNTEFKERRNFTDVLLHLGMIGASERLFLRCSLSKCIGVPDFCFRSRKPKI